MRPRSPERGFEPGAAGQVAYLTNQYPSPSHSFIRREILALEAAGWQVHRFAHRRNAVAPVDPDDRSEVGKTRVLLDFSLRGVAHLAFAVLVLLVKRPWPTLRASALALRMACKGDHRYVAHAGYFMMACSLSRQLRDLGCHHVHAHFGTNPAAVARLAHCVSGLRYSVTFHGPHEFAPDQRLNLPEKMAAASFIVVVSGGAHRRLSERYPEFASKLRWVPCGLDANWFDAPMGPASDTGELLCVARLEPQKDPLLLLAAACVLVDRGVAFRLTIAGDGTLRETASAFITENGLAEHVVLTGWQTQRQIFDRLHTARALVLSSQDEGLPVVVMEAFARGVPAIAPDVGSVSELVQTGASGWLVPRGNAMALADAMHACLLAAPDELRRLGDEARRRARVHDIRVCAGMLAEQFREAARRAPHTALRCALPPAQ